MVTACAHMKRDHKHIAENDLDTSLVCNVNHT